MRRLFGPLLGAIAACSSSDAAPRSTPHQVLLTRNTDLRVEHAFTVIPWQVKDPTSADGLWAAGTPTRITIPPGWEGGSLFLWGGVDLTALTPGREDISIAIGKNGRFRRLSLAIVIGRASTGGFGGLTIAAMDPAPAAGDYFEIGVLAGDSAHGQMLKAIRPTFFQARQVF
jgi:hypothetical protein